MPISKRVARFNRYVTNPIQRRFAWLVPGWAIVTHRGRRTGRRYRTPVNVFRRGDRYVIAAMYGTDAQWIRNVLAAGVADIQTRGRHHRVADPEIVHDPSHSVVPRPIRFILRRLRVDDFLVLSETKPNGR